MKKETIVCMAMTTWKGDYVKAVVKMMTELSESTDILFVNYPFTWKDLIWSMLGKSPAPWKQMLGIKARLEAYDGKGSIHGLHAWPILPINWIKNKRLYQLFNRINARIIASNVKRALKSKGVENYISINAYNPVIGLPLLNELNAGRTYYYCYDEISQSLWCKEHGPQYETDFAEQVDGVIVTSKELRSKMEKLNKSVTWIPNGVDYSFFHQAFQQENISSDSKRVCLIGSLDFRIDFELIEYVSQKLPEVQFDLVGRIMEGGIVDKLNQQPNVHIHGPKPVDELLPFLAASSAGIIPFVKNDFTKSIYPLKINEYLAAGLPVVSTDFANLEEFLDVIRYTSTKEQFLEALKTELDNDNSNQKVIRSQIAKQNCWTERAQKFSQYLQLDVA